MNTKLIVGVLVVVALVVWGLSYGKKPQPAPATIPSQQQDSGLTPTEENGEAMMESDEELIVKTFTVAGENFSFSADEIRVNQGDRVKIMFTNTSGTHDWTIDEFGAKTKLTSTGETVEVEFVASKTGSFEYYCGVGSHRQLGMKGNLIVE